MKPRIITGGKHQDERGTLTFNNAFDASEVKRFYTISNTNITFERGWQGHAVEQRWFSAIMGTFEIKLVKIDHWQNPSKTLQSERFIITSQQCDVLHVPAGYVSCIRATEPNSKLLVMADYRLGEIQDEYRFPLDYFKNNV
ncbi:MAG: WxcM-like domain-containing protein [Capnocytophaga sp.]|nr:WxcM-like domain-containing protein [Capnocytophaga sp.]